MKITHITTRIVSMPADNPLVVGLPTREDTREFVTLELGTDAGLVGLGLTFFGGALAGALHAAVDIACWDLRGKAEHKSVCQLLGGLRDRVPSYASGALLRHTTKHSSPPSLPTLSKPRTARTTRRLTSTSIWSPEACPRRSFIALKWSTSM